MKCKLKRITLASQVLIYGVVSDIKEESYEGFARDCVKLAGIAVFGYAMLIVGLSM